MTSTSFDFLLIGKSGAGKTATTNSILNKYEPNISSGPMKPVVERMQTEDGTKVSAIDGLNVIEVRDAADFTEVKKALADVDGISAFLIIMKFGEKFTEADWDVILATKDVFGGDVLSRFGICVFTNGDMFKRIVYSGTEKFQTIEEWLGKESGKIKELYEDCQKRVFLFENKQKTEKEQQEQRNFFFQKVNEMKKEFANKYTLKEFEEFDGKDKLIQSKRQKDMEAETQNKIIDFRRRFKVLSEGVFDRQGLLPLEEEIKNLKQDLLKEFGNESDITAPVKALLMQVQAVITKIERTPQKKYDNRQPGVKTASQNEESITIKRQLLSEIEEALANFIKLNEEFEKNKQAALELKKEIESTVKKMTTAFSDLQSDLKEPREQGKLLHEEALPAEKLLERNPKSNQGQNSSCNRQ